MSAASPGFLAFALSLACIFNISRSVAWRQAVLLAGSIGFLGFFSLDPIAFLPLAGFLALGFLGLRILQAGKSGAFAALLAITVVLFIWLKKYAFLPDAIFIDHPYVTLGLSYIFFRVLHLLIDANSNDLPASISLTSYLNYTLNFTTLVSGPIQRYQDFAQMQLAANPMPLNVIVAGQAVERIIVGYFKVNVLSLFLSMIHTSALASVASGTGSFERVTEGMLVVAIYPLYLYCNFSGYIDMVIGVARFFRIELPENFDRPFSADNFMTFWSRWHMTLSNWLKTYVYNPLVITMMRRWPSAKAEPFVGVVAYFVTFFLIGVWHGQTSVFIFFGVLQGLGMSLTKVHQIAMARWLGKSAYKALSRHWLYNTASRGLTFTYFAFSQLWFWSNWSQIGTLAHSLSPAEIGTVLATILAGSSVILALWEVGRAQLFALKLGSQTLVLSRYARTARATALAVITVATVTLLNAPAPDIVYKAF